MSDEGVTFGIVIVACVITFALTWVFSNGYIYPESFKYAEMVCESHKGLRMLDEDKTMYSEAVCKDGVIVKYNNQMLGKK